MEEERAFPNTSGSIGMSLRDWFAGQAIAANFNFGVTVPAGDYAEHCYNIADAMLAARASK